MKAVLFWVAFFAAIAAYAVIVGDPFTPALLFGFVAWIRHESKQRN